MIPHRSRRHPYVRAKIASTALTLGALSVAACSENLPFVLADDSADGSAPPVFVNPDAGSAGRRFTEYCPSSECPDGYTTCPNSRFPCDVNLLTSRDNCGACGASCPSQNDREQYECVEGRCVLQCLTEPLTLDCDGLADNGCEADPSENDSCGGCGVVCADPAKPCVHRPITRDYTCGCEGGKTWCSPQCADLKSDDAHCGDCATACSPAGAGEGGAPDPALHMYFGCVAGACDRPKCEAYWANCDGDFGNGCETRLTTAEDCGSCGNACPAGQSCNMDLIYGPQCMCASGLTFCSIGCIGTDCYGSCYDTSSDRSNCGGCGISCQAQSTSAIGICVKGTCKLECVTGQADCNGNESDGCEVDVDSDPRNCGACGNVCDAIAGQACVQGRCVVAPCPDADAGGGPQ